MIRNRNQGKKRKKWPWALLILLAAAAFAIFRILGSGSINYKQATASLRDMATYYTFSGNLMPVTDEIQTSKQQLRVREVYVKEGDTVKEGELLLRAADGTRVPARASGTLEALFAEADDLLQPGSQIARIVDYDRLEVSVNVDEYDISTLSLGKKGDVYINALGLNVPGTVSKIARDATITGGVSFYVVKLQITDVENVRSGMSAEVKVLKEEARGALSLNISTISYDEDNNPFVFVREGEREMARRYLVTGISDGVFVQVLSGLKENETIYYAEGNMTRFFPSFRGFRPR